MARWSIWRVFFSAFRCTTCLCTWIAFAPFGSARGSKRSTWWFLVFHSALAPAEWVGRRGEGLWDVHWHMLPRRNCTMKSSSFSAPLLAPSRDLGTPVEKKERRKEKEREGGKGERKEKEKERKKDENARQSIMKLMHLLYFICNLIIKKRAENLKGTLA